MPIVEEGSVVEGASGPVVAAASCSTVSFSFWSLHRNRRKLTGQLPLLLVVTMVEAGLCLGFVAAAVVAAQIRTAAALQHRVVVR